MFQDMLLGLPLPLEKFSEKNLREILKGANLRLYGYGVSQYAMSLDVFEVSELLFVLLAFVFTETTEI